METADDSLTCLSVLSSRSHSLIILDFLVLNASDFEYVSHMDFFSDIKTALFILS